MNNYKKGDIVVMNRSCFECYEGEKLEYLRAVCEEAASVLKNIHGGECIVPNHTFDLRDEPTFEIGDLIKAINLEGFELFEQVYFVGDASKARSYHGDYPIVTVSEMGTVQHFKYARKYVEKTYTIKKDCVEYPATKEQHDRYHTLMAEVTA